MAPDMILTFGKKAFEKIAYEDFEPNVSLWRSRTIRLLRYGVFEEVRVLGVPHISGAQISNKHREDIAYAISTFHSGDMTKRIDDRCLQTSKNQSEKEFNSKSEQKFDHDEPDFRDAPLGSDSWTDPPDISIPKGIVELPANMNWRNCEIVIVIGKEAPGRIGTGRRNKNDFAREFAGRPAREWVKAWAQLLPKYPVSTNNARMCTKAGYMLLRTPDGLIVNRIPSRLGGSA